VSNDKTLYVLYKQEYDDFITNILTRRHLVNDILNYSLLVKQLDEWTSFYAVLCEYVSILFRFEEVLERAAFLGDWDKKEKRWFLDQETAGLVAIFATSEVSCRHELSNHNLSLLLH
jgi:hypothetical protein